MHAVMSGEIGLATVLRHLLILNPDMCNICKDEFTSYFIVLGPRPNYAVYAGKRQSNGGEGGA
jgi:hypothetical protein